MYEELIPYLIISLPFIVYFTLVPTLTFVATSKRSSYPQRCDGFKVAEIIPWWCRNVCGGIYKGIFATPCAFSLENPKKGRNFNKNQKWQLTNFISQRLSSRC